MIRLFMFFCLGMPLAVLHALPFLPRPHRLFGVGPAGRQVLKAYELSLLPWTCAALLASLWLPLSTAAIWVPALTLIPAAVAVRIFYRCRAQIAHLAPPAPSIREACLGPESPHPRTMLVFLLPFAILAATAIYLRLHWDAIPARFPIHWGPDGTPNGWATRSAAGVYGPLVLGALIVCFLAGISALTRWGSRRSARNPAGEVVVAGTAYVIAAAFSMAGLLPLHTISAGGLLVFHAAALVLLAAIAWRALRRNSDRAQEITPETCWRWGAIYYNPDDPALFVEKRIGLGWTLNFGNRLSWVVLPAMLLLPVAVVFLARSFTSR